MANKLANKWGKIWSPSREEMEKIVSESKTFCEVLSRLVLRSMKQNHTRLKERLDRDGIDYSHLLKSQAENDLNRVHFTLRMTENSTYSPGLLKKRLIEEKYLENKCAICGLDPVWNDIPLVLVFDHINGVSNDHRLHNLRLLCPNCNSQTDTFTGRNRLKYPGTDRDNRCVDCGKDIDSRSRRCKSCHEANGIHGRKTNRPTKEELETMILHEKAGDIGKRYGVSGNAVSKWLVRLGIPQPGHGCWSKNRMTHRCVACGGPASSRLKRCKACHDADISLHGRKVVRPTKEELEKMVWDESVESIGRRYGVSGNAVHKWAKSYGIETPGRGYWAKKKAEENK